MENEKSVLMICSMTGEIRMKRFGVVKDFRGFVRKKSREMGADFWEIQEGEEVVFGTSRIEDLLAKL